MKPQFTCYGEYVHLSVKIKQLINPVYLSLLVLRQELRYLFCLRVSSRVIGYTPNHFKFYKTLLFITERSVGDDT
jgi:hypothetical protein